MLLGMYFTGEPTSLSLPTPTFDDWAYRPMWQAAVWLVPRYTWVVTG